MLHCVFGRSTDVMLDRATVLTELPRDSIDIGRQLGTGEERAVLIVIFFAGNFAKVYQATLSFTDGHTEVVALKQLTCSAEGRLTVVAALMNSI